MRNQSYLLQQNQFAVPLVKLNSPKNNELTGWGSGEHSNNFNEVYVDQQHVSVPKFFIPTMRSTTERQYSTTSTRPQSHVEVGHKIKFTNPQYKRNLTSQHSDLGMQFQLSSRKISNFEKQEKTSTQDLKALMTFLQMDNPNSMRYENHKVNIDTQQSSILIHNHQPLISLTHHDEDHKYFQLRKEDISSQISTYQKKKVHKLLNNNFDLSISQKTANQQFQSLYTYKLARDLNTYTQRDINLTNNQYYAVNADRNTKHVIPSPKAKTQTSCTESRRITSARIDQIVIKKKSEQDHIIKQVPLRQYHASPSVKTETKELVTKKVNNFIMDDQQEQDNKLEKFIKLEMNCFWDINQRKKQINFREKNLKKKLSFIKRQTQA